MLLTVLKWTICCWWSLGATSIDDCITATKIGVGDKNCFQVQIVLTICLIL